jgi:hypothetical protein
MGVFTVIGLIVGIAGLAKRDGRVALAGIVMFGIGVAGDTWEHKACSAELKPPMLYQPLGGE